LRPGPYSLRLGFYDWSGRPLWYAEGLNPFVVSYGDAEMISKAGRWLVDVPAKWTFQPRNAGSVRQAAASASARCSRRGRNRLARPSPGR
jgi:hypothetical protein